MDYDFYMKAALDEALKAYQNDEVPIGCVIVHNDEIIGKGFNKRNTVKNVLGHAEIIAINEACNTIGDWRIENSTLLVTVEPCPMCSGAILQARISRVVFGAKNNKAGCCGSIYNLLDDDRFNHKAEVIDGVLEDDCSFLMKKFFKEKREGGKL